jgi:23S rRNA (cytosine1962-C5)-methyltransferase
LDPPPFARHRDAVDSALKGYRAINYHGFKRLNPRGMLFTFSCSQLVGKDAFIEAVQKAGAQAGRRVSILRELQAAPCHLRNLYHPEGQYLKGLVLSAD